MTETWSLLVLPLLLGLVGLVEPCSVGSSLLFVKYIEGRSAAEKVRTTVVFALARAVFLGSMGAGAAFAGAAFLDLQRAFWVGLGALYLAIGAIYLAGRQRWLMRGLGPALARAGERRGAVALGLVFGLNVPACAAPLLAAVLAAGLGAGGLLRGFASLAVFGLALSLPLVAIVLSGRGRVWLDRLASLSARVPRWTGVVFVGLGALSIHFADEVVGAHLLGPHAEEAINVFALAIRHGLTASDLKRTPWAYPTVCSDVPHMV